MSLSPDQALAQQAAVSLCGVSKTYRLGDGTVLRAADDITHDIPAGVITTLVGASGSGKSTLLHLIGSIDVPDSGTITVAGQELSTLNRKQRADYRSRIGFIFQRYHLLPSLTAMDNVLAPLAARKVDFDKHQRASDLLDMVGLQGRAHSLPSQLSGGQQQRVAIARALVNSPHVLLADEPTGNLDSTTAHEILELVKDLQRELNATVLIATHDPNVAAMAPNRLTVVDGKLHSAEMLPA